MATAPPEQRAIINACGMLNETRYGLYGTMDVISHINKNSNGLSDKMKQTMSDLLELGTEFEIAYSQAIIRAWSEKNAMVSK